MNNISVLAIDDSSEFVELTADALQIEDDEISVKTATDSEKMVNILNGEPSDLNIQSFDCIVSDYEMPSIDGLELLEEVRSVYPDMPFILYTGKGSETIAADAISKGVDDYLQKDSGSDQYTLLANRIRNAVANYRMKKKNDQQQRFLEKILRRATDMIAVISPNGDIEFVSGSVQTILGYSAQEIKQKDPFSLIHEADQSRMRKQFERRLSNPEEPTDISFNAIHKNGHQVNCSARAYNLTGDPDVEGVLIYTRKENNA
jgi:PAS domain S-box-containing protein